MTIGLVWHAIRPWVTGRFRMSDQTCVLTRTVPIVRLHMVGIDDDGNGDRATPSCQLFEVSKFFIRKLLRYAGDTTNLIELRSIFSSHRNLIPWIPRRYCKIYAVKWQQTWLILTRGTHEPRLSPFSLWLRPEGKQSAFENPKGQLLK